MPILLTPPQCFTPRPSVKHDTPPTPSYSFNSYHSLNPSFRRHSSIRSATVFNLSITLVFSRSSVKYDAAPFRYRFHWS
ncbi:hypothetical protein K503DRAFT_767842 [Rhizopogon vinicolor AM-OR11-026]|uniref:Uncharacterized protein n=1 Tax=Rhizopogon vinicolor AM-OR11-026 TaxID=1314800 RepID=A0A1B7N8P6_9AGAM|nr:hypothetical protein K503DRAFT_767842 [Rhizopogon vinicolor AM-OR11-026]